MNKSDTTHRPRTPSFIEPLESRRLLAAGDLDPTFGDGGTVALRVGEYSAIDDLVVLDDGRIIASVRSSGEVFLLRLHPDGTLDATFGIDGRLPFGGDDLERLPDGDILALGHEGVRRYNPDFTLDPVFGDGGFIRTAQPPEDAAVQPDGNLLVVDRHTLTRYHADGRVDTSFGNGGTVRPQFRDLYQPEDRADFEFLIGVDVQPGGNIVVGGGITFDTETEDGRTGAADFTFARYLPDGQLDLSFGNLGRLTVHHHNHDAYIDDFAMRPDGSIVMAGGGLYGDGRTILIERDGRYGSTVLQGFYEPRVAVRDDGAFAVIDRDSFAIIEADHDAAQGVHQEFYTRPIFHEHDRYPEGFAVAYQPDGKLVAAGQSDGHLALARLQPSSIEQDPFPPHEDVARGRLVEAEDFDIGGEGTSYHDADPANRGNAYRSSGVDVGFTSDSGGGYAVGWTEPGEWLEYTIDIDSAGAYNVLTRVANTAPGASFHIELDGLDVTGSIAVPDTGSWHRSKTVASRDIDIAAGEHVLRLVFDTAASTGAVGNFNWLGLVHGLDVSFGEAGVAPAGGWLLPEPGGTTVSVYYDGISRLSADGTSLTKISDTFRWGEVHDVLLQPDGRILVAADETIADRRVNVLRRFNRDGSVDATFSRTGYFESDTPIVRLAIQPDGRILADSGSTIRLFPDGTRDIRFPSITGTLTGVAGDGTIYTYSTELGACNPDSYWPECDRHMHVYRWLPNGDSDRSYAHDGVWTVTLREDDEDTPWFWGQTVLPDGSFVSGTIRNNRNDFAGAYESGRFILHPDGRITGSVSASGVYYFHGDLLAARHDGAVVLAGRLVNGDDMIFERDWHWGISGLPATPWRELFPYHSIHDLAFQEDGKLLVSSGGIVRFDAPPPRQTPRSAVPWSVGRRIEAEDFDDGGPGISYQDVEPQNRGGSYRVSRVDIGPTADAGGGFAVGWTEPGEWLEYTIAVPRDGLFDLDVRVANAAPGARFHLEIDGADVTGPLGVPDTGGFHQSATVTGSRIPVARGTHVLRLAFDQAASNGAVGNFNWLQLRPLPVRPPRPAVRPEVRRTVPAPSTPGLSVMSEASVLAQPDPDEDSRLQRRRPARPAPVW